MKKLSLIVVLALAIAAGFAQGTDLTATYTFSDVTNYHTDTSPCDNTITGLTMGPMKKVGIISTSSKSNFRGRDWPTGTVVDTLKYIGFKITANSGYQFTVKKIQFGLGKSNTGPVTAEWRGSADGYATPFASDDYTLGNNITVNNGVLTISANSSTGNTLTLSGYSNITSCDFRLCFCNGPTNGTAGLQGPLTVTLDVQSTGGGTDPTITITGTPLSDFTYIVGSGPSTAQSFSVEGSNLTGDITVTAPTNYEVSTGTNPYSNTLTLTQAGGTVTATPINVRLVAGLAEGNYSGNVQCTSPGATAQNVSLNGSVGAPLVRHWVDFENEGEVKQGYALGQLILSNLNWELDEVLVFNTPASGDWYDGNRSARFYGKATSRMTMLEDKAWGGGDISFQYRQYGSDTQAAWVVEYSVDQGTTWIQIGEPFTPTDQVQTFTGTINNSRDIRLQFRIANDDGGTSYRRWNLDNIDLSDYYDFFKDVPTVVGAAEEVEITMLSNHANYSRTYTPGPVPVPDFNVMFHDCLTLIGDGPWEIDTDIILNKQPDSYWAAYKVNNVWTAVEMVGGHARLNVPAGTFAANNEIELLIGYGKNPTVPVELSSFTATINAENYVLLTWVSQSESNISGYNVYRNTSDDLSSAIKISDLIQGTNSSEATTYTYLDQELEQSGTYYYWLQNVDLDGTMSFYGPVNVVFSVEEEGGTPEIPFATKLENAYPNPFNPSTTIRYQLKDAGDVKIDIYNTRGQLVRSFSRTHDAPGYYQINWDGRDSSGKSVSSGVYQYKMTSGKYSATKKMVLKK